MSYATSEAQPREGRGCVEIGAFRLPFLDNEHMNRSLRQQHLFVVLSLSVVGLTALSMTASIASAQERPSVSAGEAIDELSEQVLGLHSTITDIHDQRNPVADKDWNRVIAGRKQAELALRAAKRQLQREMEIGSIGEFTATQLRNRIEREKASLSRALQNVPQPYRALRKDPAESVMDQITPIHNVSQPTSLPSRERLISDCRRELHRLSSRMQEISREVSDLYQQRRSGAITQRELGERLDGEGGLNRETTKISAEIDRIYAELERHLQSPQSIEKSESDPPPTANRDGNDQPVEWTQSVKDGWAEAERNRAAQAPQKIHNPNGSGFKNNNGQFDKRGTKPSTNLDHLRKSQPPLGSKPQHAKQPNFAKTDFEVDHDRFVGLLDRIRNGGLEGSDVEFLRHEIARAKEMGVDFWDRIPNQSFERIDHGGDYWYRLTDREYFNLRQLARQHNLISDREADQDW